MVAQVFYESVPFRLRVVQGRRIPITRGLQSPGTLKAERKRQADSIRREKQVIHEAIGTTDRFGGTTVVPRRRGDGDHAGGSRRRQSQLTGESAAWLASLQSVVTEYRRAKAVERAAEQRETVRLRREARDDARTAASSELDQRRMRSAFAEQRDRRAVSSALERKAIARRQAAVSTIEDRRRAGEFTTARREKAAFADNVARRIGACSQAHVRFVQQEHQDLRRQLAAMANQRLKDERGQRSAELEHIAEARRKAIATQADADRFVTRKLYSAGR